MPPRSFEQRRAVRRYTHSAIRALTEAEGLCERCWHHPTALVVRQEPDHLAVVCVNVPGCDRRLRARRERKERAS